MTDYNSGDWFGWNGGECPVHPETLVDWVTEEGCTGTSAAKRLAFREGTNIIAFRVIKPYREPREVYLKEWSQYNLLSGKTYAKSTWGECSPNDPGAVLFREVIE